MRIAIFTDTFYPNIDGVVTSTINLVKTLSKKGHKILIIAPDYKKNQEISLHSNISIARMRSVPLLNYKEFRFVLPCFKKCLMKVKSFKPDLIHIHTYSTLGLTGSKIAKKLKLPLIGTYHTIAAEFIKYLSLSNLFYIDRLFNRSIFPRKRMKLRILKDRLLKGLIWKFTIRLYNNCDIVIASSESIEATLKRKGLKREIILISPGVQLKLFQQKKNYNQKIRGVLHVGRASFEKNIEQTILAFSGISKKYPDVRYTIIGEGPALRPLKNLSKKLRLSARIKFLGKVPHNRLPAYYKKSDFFITASAMETSGLVVLEAMASGLPIIGINKFGIRDTIKNGRNGFVVEPGDLHGMCKYMEMLIKNPKLVQVIGKNAAKTAKVVSVERTSDLVEKAYKRLAEH